MPGRISTGLTAIEAFDNLTTLAAVDKVAIHYAIGHPLLTVRTVREEVLSFSKVIHRTLHNMEILDCFCIIICDLLAAL